MVKAKWVNEMKNLDKEFAKKFGVLSPYVNKEVLKFIRQREKDLLARVREEVIEKPLKGQLDHANCCGTCSGCGWLDCACVENKLKEKQLKKLETISEGRK